MAEFLRDWAPFLTRIRGGEGSNVRLLEARPPADRPDPNTLQGQWRDRALFGETPRAARTWRHKRRIVMKAEVVRHPGRDPKNNPRRVITSLCTPRRARNVPISSPMVAHRESATLAERLIRETCVRQGIGRGPAMTSKPVALLLADLGGTKTHARPHVSNDNPFSEAHFKTLKYRPAFPERFGSIQDARAYCHVFFPWYNAEHHHVGLGLLTPGDVHHGLAEQRVAARATVLATAYAAHPERFPGGLRHPPTPPAEVWINRPKTRATEAASCTATPELAV